MRNALKDLLRKSPILVKFKRRAVSSFDFSLINIVTAFAAFKPNSAGRYRARAKITLEAVNQTPLLLAQLSKLSGPPNFSSIEVDDFPSCALEREAATKLGELFEASGSDKARHGHHLLYGPILRQSDTVEKIFEIGLGTDDTEIVSTMGLGATPGASLRAFRDFCPNAEIFGADIDKRIMFSEARIKTYFVDQTDPSTFANIAAQVGSDFDLVIDDGLHSPNANIASLIFGLRVIKPGGWVVIEDISLEAGVLWEIVAALLPAGQFRTHIVRAKTTLLFAVQALTAADRDA